MNMGDEHPVSDHGLLTTICCDAHGKPAYALEGSVFMAGAAVQWLGDELGIIEDAAETEALAGQIANTEGVYLVPAFAGLGAPYWDMNARGGILGLTRGVGRAHIARAALESIAYRPLTFEVPKWHKPERVTVLLPGPYASGMTHPSLHGCTCGVSWKEYGRSQPAPRMERLCKTTM